MWNWISRVAEVRDRGERAVLVTLTQSTGSAPREAGAKMLVLESGEFDGTIGGGHLEELALADAKTMLLEDAPARTIKYPLGAKTGQCCGGVVELLFEPLNNGPTLYLFGAGHVGQALCQTLTGTPFRVEVIDPRPEWIHSPDIPKSVKRHSCEWEDFAPDMRWSATKTYIAIMTHRHDTDQAILEFVLKMPARYVGLIGSLSKRGRFRERLTAKGVDPDRFDQVRCPIGLNLGGKAPKEVAVSVTAELLQLHYGARSPVAQE